LLRRFKSVVAMLARPYFILGGDQEDLVQEGMIGLYRAIREYRHNTGTAPPAGEQSPANAATFATFATTCIKNQIKDAIKTAARKKHSPLNTSISMDQITLNIPDPTADPALILIHQEDIKTVFQDQLTPLESSILHLYLLGQTYAEIAQAINRTPKAVDNALYRIRQKVSKIGRHEE